MNAKAILTSALFIGSAVVLAFYLIKSREGNVSHRLPSLLELSVPLFLIGLAVLPQAFPSAFAAILHHSIASDYVHPLRADGTRVTETWLLARWWTPISRVLFVSVFAGTIWAAWNIFRAQDRKLNLLSLCLGLLWTGFGTITNLRIWPF
jgi:hypothetical protein